MHAISMNEKEAKEARRYSKKAYDLNTCEISKIMHNVLTLARE